MTKEAVLLNAKGATGIGIYTDMSDFDKIAFSFATDGGGTAALTVKFQGSIQDTAPNFAAAQTVTNQWDFIDVIDAEDGASIDGDVGVAVATADDYRLFLSNAVPMKWICARVTAWTAGTVTVKVRGFNFFK